MEEENKIEITSFYEILNDNLAMVILEKILECFDNIESKNAVEEFIADFSPVLIHEAYLYLKDKKLISENSFYKSEEIKKKIQKYRMLTTKKKVKNSEYIKSIRDNMGIDLENDIFDINIVELDNIIKRFNFSEFNKRSEKDFLGMCYWTNAEFSKVIFEEITRLPKGEYEKIIDIIIDAEKDDIKNLEKSLSGNRYSYRSSKLFNKADLIESDKLFILYRFNMITLLIELEKFFKKNYITITCNDIKICDVYKFITKMIALEIEILGCDIGSLDTAFSIGLQEKLDKTILKENTEFYSLNRSLRNNIHYGIIDVIDEKIYDEIIELQKKYMSIVYEEINNKLCFELKEEDLLLTDFFKYCSDNNIEKEEIDNNYENYYTQYYYKKSIDRNI